MNSNSNRIFRHYKGGLYRFIGEGLNSETFTVLSVKV